MNERFVVAFPENQQFYYDEEINKRGKKFVERQGLKRTKNVGQDEADLFSAAVNDMLTPTKRSRIDEPPTESEAVNSQCMSAVQKVSTPQREEGGDAKKEGAQLFSTQPIDDQEYQTAMATLVQSIHKHSSEWRRKQREFTMAVTRFQNNPNTNGSDPLRKLSQILTKGDDIDHTLQNVEAQHVINEKVSHDQQVECKTYMTELVGLAKSGNAIKLTLRGCILLLRTVRVASVTLLRIQIRTVCNACISKPTFVHAHTRHIHIHPRTQKHMMTLGR